jgi:N-acetylglucosamine kinase-like BadF-type ATPase
MTTKDFSIGIVGQASESFAIGLCHKSERVRLERAPGMDWRAMPEGSVRARIGELLVQLADALGLSSRNELASRTRNLALAVSGIDNRFSLSLLERSLDALGFDFDTVQLTSVGEAAHVGAFLGRPGLLVHCGHGVSVYVKSDDGKETLLGGWGSVSGDRGSGPWIGRKAMIAVTEVIEGVSDDGRQRFVDDLIRESQMPLPISLLEQIETAHYCSGELGVRQELNRLGGLTVRLAEQGDQYARALVERSWNQVLLPIASAVTVTMGAPLPVCFRGGILECFPYYCRGLATRLATQFPMLQISNSGCLGNYATVVGIGVLAAGRKEPLEMQRAGSQLAAKLGQDPRILPRKRECCAIQCPLTEIVA